MGNIGTAYAILGDARQALMYFEKASAINREIGDLMGLALGLGNMSRLFGQAGEPARGLPLAMEAESIFTKIGHKKNVQLTQELIALLKTLIEHTINASPQSTAFEAFLLASNLQFMQVALVRHPLLKDRQFISEIEYIINTEFPPEQKHVYEQRLGWLRQITGK